jgi:hypothetical protein
MPTAIYAVSVIFVEIAAVKMDYNKIVFTLVKQGFLNRLQSPAVVLSGADPWSYNTNISFLVDVLYCIC